MMIINPDGDLCSSVWDDFDPSRMRLHSCPNWDMSQLGLLKAKVSMNLE
jgi:hypothetical protein